MTRNSNYPPDQEILQLFPPDATESWLCERVAHDMLRKCLLFTFSVWKKLLFKQVETGMMLTAKGKRTVSGFIGSRNGKLIQKTDNEQKWEWIYEKNPRKAGNSDNNELYRLDKYWSDESFNFVKIRAHKIKEARSNGK